MPFIGILSLYKSENFMKTDTIAAIATALSDFIQGIIMLIGVVAMVFCFMNHGNVDWDLSKLTDSSELGWFTFSSSNTGL